MVGPILPETYQLIWGTLPTYIASKGLAKRQLDGLNTVMESWMVSMPVSVDPFLGFTIQF